MNEEQNVKNVILYFRVSTDEQAKGFSLEYQEEVLNRFCEIKGFNVIKSYKEDESAKDFEGRPDWTKLQNYIKGNKNKVDLVLVHKWDRFARDILEAYKMLAIFDSWGVGVNAVEQWLDMSVPESKIMLSIYLSQGEVERLKISARVKDGNHKALMSGYFINKSPYGYTNCELDNKRHSLEVVEEKAYFVKIAFQRVASGVESALEILHDLKQKGFKMEKTNFFLMLRKVVYTGKINVPEYKKFPKCIVEGHHKAIIDIGIFNKVQSILDGKKWHGKIPNHKNELFPLRNYLVCEFCGENMTASSSKGRSKLYHYYHCHNKHRVPQDKAHAMFEEILIGLTLNDGIKQLYSEVIKDASKSFTSEKQVRIKNITNELNKIEELIANADDKLLANEIGIDTYNRMLNKLESQKNTIQLEFSNLTDSKNPIEKYIEGGLALLSNLPKIYTKSDYTRKRSIIGSIITDKMIISDSECRTTNLNKVVELFSSNNGGNGVKKKGTKSVKSDLSPYVPRAGIEPALQGNWILNPARLPIPPPGQVINLLVCDTNLIKNLNEIKDE